MLDPRQFPWRDQLVLTRDIDVPGERRNFYAAVRKGQLVPLRRGVYISDELWRGMDVDEQYRARVHAAVAHENTDPVMSHASAAALWLLPLIPPYPQSVHVVHDRAGGGRSTSALVRHAVGVPVAIEWIDGVRVTSLAKTVVDVASTSTFEQGVSVADAALRRGRVPIDGLPASTVTSESLLAEVGLLPISRGTARARRAIEFADGAADRPGESVSRCNIHLAGLTAPHLQAPLRGASGRLWHVDFWWPEFNIIGEFDGKGKYTDPRYLRGRTPAEVLNAEKAREDDLRAVPHGFTRWPWSVAVSVQRLRTHLVAAGVR